MRMTASTADNSGLHGLGRNRPAVDHGAACPLPGCSQSCEQECGQSEDFSFVQISDSHIGFNKGANPDVSGTLRKAIERDEHASIAGISAGLHAPHRRHHPELQAAEFDTAAEVIKTAGLGKSSMFPASMTFPSTMACSTSRGSAKARSAVAGTAITTRAFTSSGLNNCVTGRRHGQHRRRTTRLAQVRSRGLTAPRPS